MTSQQGFQKLPFAELISSLGHHGRWGYEGNLSPLSTLVCFFYVYTTPERLLQNFKQKNPTLIIFSNFEVKLKNKITENMPCYLGFCYKTKTLWLSDFSVLNVCVPLYECFIALHSWGYSYGNMEKQRENIKNIHLITWQDMKKCSLIRFSQ